MDMILTCLGEVYGSNSGLGFGECCSGSSRDQRCAGGGGGGHGNTARHHHGGHGDIPAHGAHGAQDPGCLPGAGALVS